MKTLRIVTRVILTITVISALFTACSEQTDTSLAPDQPSYIANNQNNTGLDRAMEVQTRNTERFLEIKGIVGTGTGRSVDGTPVMIIYTERTIGNKEIPAEIEGIPVREEVVGWVDSLS